MDKDIFNIIYNSAPNDFLKMECLDAQRSNMSKGMQKVCINIVFKFCVLYDMNYFIEKLYKEKEINEDKDNSFVYWYYLKKNHREDKELKAKLLSEYKTEKDKKKMIKEINKLSIINLARKLMIYEYKHSKYDRDITVGSLVNDRIDIIADCMKYILLSEEWELEKNKKLERIMNWNIYSIKKHHTVNDELYLMQLL